MILKIIQPAGLGDIFFCIKIARVYANSGWEVYWPVIPKYSWVNEYLVFNNIHWEDVSNPDKILDLQSAGAFFPQSPIMDSKYNMAGMSFHDWKDFLVLKRNREKEKALYDTVVTKEPYCLISESFGTAGNQTRCVKPNTLLPQVAIQVLPPFNAFDWCRVIEDAEELDLVDTCFTYLIEVLNIKAKKLNLYSRHEDNFFHTKHLWTVPWKYIA